MYDYKNNNLNIMLAKYFQQCLKKKHDSQEIIQKCKDGSIFRHL